MSLNLVPTPSDLAPERGCGSEMLAFGAHLDGAGNAELQRLARTRRYEAGATLIPERGEATMVGTVVSGVLKLTKTLSDGREQIVGLVHRGDFFGRPFAEISECALEAATDVEICVMERHAFEALLARHPELEHELFLWILRDLAFARERLLLMGCQNTFEKVSGYLLLAMVRMGGDALSADKGSRIAFSPISRRDLASYLGTTIETISRHIHQLSRQGIIRILDHQRFQVLDLSRLLQASGLDLEDIELAAPGERAATSRLFA